MSEEFKSLKSEITGYVDKENEHLEDKINNRLLGLEKVLDSIEVKVVGVSNKLYTDSDLRLVAADEAGRAYRKFWGNFKWFIGVTLVSVITLLLAGIITWSDVRDYTKFKTSIESDVKTNTSDIKELQFKHIGDNVSEDVGDIKEDLRKIKIKLKIE